MGDGQPKPSISRRSQEIGTGINKWNQRGSRAGTPSLPKGTKLKQNSEEHEVN